MPKKIDLTGRQFGRLVVIGESKKRERKNAYWFCECSCGNLACVSTHKLKSGHTKSCGCLNKEVLRKQQKECIKPDESFYSCYRKATREDGSNTNLHRLIMEGYLGRKLDKSEEVHHINENKLDNRLKNLELIDKNKHRSYHGLQNRDIDYSVTYRKRLRKARINHGYTRFSEQQVADIKMELLNGASNSELARRYSVPKSTITAIKTGRNWRDYK